MLSVEDYFAKNGWSQVAGKESTCNAGEPGLISGSGRSPGAGEGYPLQYSGLENSMECEELDTTERLSLSLSNSIIAFCPHQELPEFRVSRNSSTWPVWSSPVKEGSPPRLSGRDLLMYRVATMRTATRLPC